MTTAVRLPSCPEPRTGDHSTCQILPRFGLGAFIQDNFRLIMICKTDIAPFAITANHGERIIKLGILFRLS